MLPSAGGLLRSTVNSPPSSESEFRRRLCRDARTSSRGSFCWVQRCLYSDQRVHVLKRTADLGTKNRSSLWNEALVFLSAKGEPFNGQLISLCSFQSLPQPPTLAFCFFLLCMICFLSLLLILSNMVFLEARLHLKLKTSSRSLGFLGEPIIPATCIWWN